MPRRKAKSATIGSRRGQSRERGQRGGSSGMQVFPNFFKKLKKAVDMGAGFKGKNVQCGPSGVQKDA